MRLCGYMAERLGFRGGSLFFFAGAPFGRMKWGTWGRVPVLQKPHPGRGGGKYLGGNDSLLSSSRASFTLTKPYIPYPCFLSPCRLILLLTRTHFWSLSTLRVVESRGRGEKSYIGSSKMEGEDR